jgi:hypothetical protein
MRRVKSLALALVALAAALAMMSSAALALTLPENLPTSAVVRNWTGETEGSYNLDLPAPVTCETATTEGTEEAGKPLGLFHEHLKNCTGEEGKVKCTGEGEEAGVILILGNWHLVFDRKKGGTFVELTTAILYLLTPVKFKCTVFFTVELKGEQLCLHLKPTEKAISHSDHCIAEGLKQTEEWCKSDVGGTCVEAVVPVLLANQNGGAFKEVAGLGLETRRYGVELFADV